MAQSHCARTRVCMCVRVEEGERRWRPELAQLAVAGDSRHCRLGNWNFVVAASNRLDYRFFPHRCTLHTTQLHSSDTPNVLLRKIAEDGTDSYFIPIVGEVILVFLLLLLLVYISSSCCFLLSMWFCACRQASHGVSLSTSLGHGFN